MNKQRACVAIWSILIAATVALTFSGCGGSEYESNEDFVKSLGTHGEADGTMPPVGASMDDVAKIRLETTDLDLGLVKNDAIHHHKLKVYNDGKLPLKITKIDTTCACTMGHVTPENSVVAPGGESWIDVTLEPARVPGFESHKVLTITSTDPKQTQVEVQVRASIEPEFFIESDTVDFGDVAKGEVVERRLRYRQLQDEPANLTGVQVLTLGADAPKIPGIQARLEEVPEAEWQNPGKKEADIVIATGPELSAGAFSRNLVVLTDYKRNILKRFRIEATGTVLAPYAVAPIYPTRIILHPENADTYVARATFTSTAPITLAIGEISNPAVSATVVPGTSPNEMHVDVHVPVASVPNKLFDETVSVQVTAEGKTFTEIVGVRNAGNAEASGHEDHDH
jgi:hypothetical protein